MEIRRKIMTICKVISEAGAVPVKIWTDDVDIGSIEQLTNEIGRAHV